MMKRTVLGVEVSGALIGVVEASLVLRVAPEDVNRWCRLGSLFGHDVAYKDDSGYFWSIPIDSLDYFNRFHNDQLERARKRWQNQIIAATQLSMDFGGADTYVHVTDAGEAALKKRK